MVDIFMKIVLQLMENNKRKFREYNVDYSSKNSFSVEKPISQLEVL